MADPAPPSGAELADLLAHVLGGLPTGVAVFQLEDADDPASLRLRYANEAAGRLAGYDMAAEVGRTILEIAPDIVEAGLGARYAEVARTGREQDLGQVRYGDERVTERVYAIRAVPLPGRSMAVLFEDATPREELRALREAEAAREASEDRLRLATEAADIGTWDYDLDSGRLVWDARCKAAFGLPPEAEVDYDAFLDRLHPDDRDRTDAVVQRALDPGGPGAYDIQYRTRAPDGTVRWVRAMGRAHFEGAGEARRATRFVGTVHDITEQREAQRILEQRVAERTAEAQAAYERLDAVLNGTTDLIAAVDRDLRLIAFNDPFGAAFEAVFGRPLAVGMNVEEALPEEPGEREQARAHWRRALAGEAFSVLREEAFPGLGYRAFETLYSPIRDAEGAVTGAASVVRDVTEQRRQEEALRGFSDDLKALHRITTARQETAEEVYQDYLRAGCEMFEMPIGILSETPLDPATGERRYRLHSVETPDPSLEAGLEVPLSDAFCDAVVARGRTVSYADVAHMDGLDCHPAHVNFGFRSFIGTPITVDGELFGTLNFVSPEPRPEGFAPHEHELVEVMAESVSRMLSLQRAERAEAKAEARFEALVANLHEGVVFQDPEGRIIASNPAAAEILGLSADQLAGRTSLDPDWRAVDAEGRPLPGDRHPAMVALREGRDVTGFVQGVHTPEGRLRWLLVNSNLVFADAAPGDGRPAIEGVVSTFSDITEQRAAEAALRESEARHRTTLETLSEGVVLVAADGEVLASNAAACGILGCATDELKTLFGQRALVLDETGLPIPPERFPERRVFETGEAVDGEVQGIALSDGTVRWLSVSARPVRSEMSPGGPAAVVVSFVDVTEQREAERALRDREAQLRTAQEIAGLGSWRWDPAADEITWSAELFRIFGVAPDAFEPDYEHYLALLPEAERARIQERVQRALEAHEPYEVRHAIVRPDGEVRHVQSRGEVVVSESGDVEALQGVVLDVTEQHRAQAAVERYARELEERNTELEQFAYVASHDLQEPLRMVSSFLQLLERRYGEALDETAREYIDFAVDGAKRMQKLIQDLLSYSRVGTRGKPFQAVDTGRVVEEVLTDLGPAIEERAADVAVGPLPTLQADPTQVRQLFQNLVGNALKFGAEAGPEVRVAAEPAARDGAPGWRFTVSDDGIGVAPEHAERIFQIFQRLHTREEYAGTGIGLAICKKIAERHGGTIGVESEPGHGATFHVWLPESPPSAPAPSPPPTDD